MKRRNFFSALTGIVAGTTVSPQATAELSHGIDSHAVQCPKCFNMLYWPKDMRAVQESGDCKQWLVELTKRRRLICDNPNCCHEFEAAFARRA